LIEGLCYNNMSIQIRKAQAQDQNRIKQLIRSAHLNPLQNHWPNFWVAQQQQQIVGCIQLRPRPQQQVELASLVVDPDYQHLGLGSRLVHTALAAHQGPIYLMCVTPLVSFYQQHQFINLPRKQWPRYFLPFDYGFRALQAFQRLRGKASNIKLNIMRYQPNHAEKSA
jgi:N-acetylglutamate synthase-like GNAT family acetyltransferase